jgi:hypothetical protein
MLRESVLCLAVIAAATPLFGQTPQPFPGVRTTEPPPSQPRTTPSTARAQGSKPAPAAATPAQAEANAPTSAVVGFPIYPGARFLASYDAGKMQRYYWFGSASPFVEVVKYYQTSLKDRGAQVYVDPPTHMFTQRFREETMAFPPGVTVKDWTSGGSQGYLHLAPGAQPARFPTVIVIVPPPPAEAR